MNTELINKLADHLDTISPSDFNITTLAHIDKHGELQPRCIAGHCLDMTGTLAQDCYSNGWTPAMRIKLDISYEEVTQLCAPYKDPEWNTENNDPKVAAQVLRYFAETNQVAWPA